MTKPYVRVEYVDKSAYEDNKEIRNKLKLFEKKKENYLMNSLITSNPKEASNLRTYIPEYDISIEENNVAHVQAGDYESFTYQIYNDYFSDELHNLFLRKR